MEEVFNSRMGRCFGSWLRAECPDFSPFWEVFYKKEEKEDEIEEIIPDTQEHQRQIQTLEAIQPSSPLEMRKRRNEHLNADHPEASHQNSANATTDQRVLCLLGPKQNQNCKLQTVDVRLGK